MHHTGDVIQVISFAEDDSNTAMNFIDQGVATLYSWNGTRFISGTTEWQPPTGFALQGYYNQLMQLQVGAVTDLDATINCDLGNDTHSVTLVASTNSIEFPFLGETWTCLLYTSPSPRDSDSSRMPSSA